LSEGDVVYVGDAENDQPAFDVISCSIAIDPHRKLRARVHVDTPTQALQKVLEITQLDGHFK
jgi:phosphoserine phosphatase